MSSSIEGGNFSKYCWHQYACLNCGKGESVPGQMIVDVYGQAFCSKECGWSTYLRPPSSVVCNNPIAAPPTRRMANLRRKARKPNRNGSTGKPPQPSTAAESVSTVYSDALFDFLVAAGWWEEEIGVQQSTDEEHRAADLPV